MNTFLKNHRSILAGVCAAIALAVIMISSNGMREADAATQDFPPGVPVYAMPIYLQGSYTATVTPVKFTLPYAGRLVGFSAATGGSSGTVTIDLKAGGVSLLSAPISASTSVVEATVATAAVADEAELTVVLTLSGSNPSVSSVTAVPVFVR